MSSELLEISKCNFNYKTSTLPSTLTKRAQKDIAKSALPPISPLNNVTFGTIVVDSRKVTVRKLRQLSRRNGEVVEGGGRRGEGYIHSNAQLQQP